MGLIHLLSSIPDHGAPQNLAERLLQWATPELQNLLHIPLFGGLAATWYWALRPMVRNRLALPLVVFTITIAYAFFDEWHQLRVPGRYGSLTDVALDVVGIVLALAYIHFRADKALSNRIST
jgi:VanZ family protein